MSDTILNFSDKGDGKALLILHGLFGSADNWNQIAKPLIEEFRVIQVDLRNHGRSFHHNTMSYPAMAQDIENLLDHLNIASAIIMGHSMGGKVAMEFAQNHPYRCDQLIVIDIAPRHYQHRHTDVFKGLNAVNLAELNSRKDAEATLADNINEKMVAQFLLKGLHRVDNQFQWRFNLPILESEYENLIKSTSTENVFDKPTLFIKGMNSNYIEAIDQPIILKLFPLAQAKIIAEAGHWLHAEKPRLMLNIVSKFLNIELKTD